MDLRVYTGGFTAQMYSYVNYADAARAGRAVLRAPSSRHAKLLQRVFDLDLEHCPNYGGELKIFAAILEQPVIE